MLFAAPLHLFKKMTSQNPTQCHTLSHDLTRCRTMSLNSPNCQLTSHIKSHNVSHDVTQYHIVSQIVTKCNILSLCVTKFHTMLQNDTNFYFFQNISFWWEMFNVSISKDFFPLSLGWPPHKWLLLWHETWTSNSIEKQVVDDDESYAQWRWGR